MCGIVGTVGGAPETAALSAMLDCVAHRGPDGRGLHIADQVGLGHVRLAIVDLTDAGAQPMITPDGRYALAYNGELYNHHEFRPMLKARGARFVGHSDTETLLWLLAICGESILPKLNGIFAFAFHDIESKSVLLARDPLGVKPLYYAVDRGGVLRFASEIKGLFATPGFEARVNTDDLAEFFLFHFIAGERTAFAGVHELMPGHALRHENGRVRSFKYWDPMEGARHPQREGDTERLRTMLEHAVDRQLMSDVPIGVKASGGLDSGLVTHLAARRGARLAGYCYRDVDHDYDEFDAARRIAEPWGTDVREVVLQPKDVPDLLEKLTWFNDEPLPRPHHVADYAVARHARAAGYKVLLSGEGGDELFGGYRRYIACSEAMASTGDLSPLVYGQNAVAIPRLLRFWPDARITNPFRAKCAEDTRGLDLINRQLLADQRTFLQHFLQRSDRMGMAVGVEVRVPLLDVPLVEYVNGLPGRAKIAGETTKVGLRAAARGLLPEDIVVRPKQAFEMPMAPLLRSGPVASLLDDVLLSNPRSGQLFEPAAIRALVHDFRAGQEDLWKMVWLLLTFELWLRAFNVSP